MDLRVLRVSAAPCVESVSELWLELELMSSLRSALIMWSLWPVVRVASNLAISSLVSSCE